MPPRTQDRDTELRTLTNKRSPPTVETARQQARRSSVSQWRSAQAAVDGKRTKPCDGLLDARRGVVSKDPPAWRPYAPEDDRLERALERDDDSRGKDERQDDRNPGEEREVRDSEGARLRRPLQRLLQEEIPARGRGQTKNVSYSASRHALRQEEREGTSPTRPRRSIDRKREEGERRDDGEGKRRQVPAQVVVSACSGQDGLVQDSVRELRAEGDRNERAAELDEPPAPGCCGRGHRAASYSPRRCASEPKLQER
jgi:hypothetical protein